MKFKKIMENARAKYEKNAEGLPKKDLAWLREKIEKANPRWTAYDDADAKEYFVLTEMSTIISKIKNTKPKNMRQFIETEVRRTGYAQAIAIIRSKIKAAVPKDEVALGTLSKKIDELLSEVKQKDPDYLPIMKKFFDIAVIELNQKRKGVAPEDAHFHIR
jgi:hypothetical protein